jgi:hypothetical protein
MWYYSDASSVAEPANFALERTACSHPLAAAAHHEGYAYMHHDGGLVKLATGPIAG